MSDANLLPVPKSVLQKWGDASWRSWAKAYSDNEYREAELWIALATENTMHTAWRKRGEEAEAALAAMTQRAEAAEKRVAELESTNRDNAEARQMLVDDLIALQEGRDVKLMHAEAVRLKIAELEAWKAEQLAVEAEWDCQAIARELDLPLGCSIHGELMSAVKSMKSRIAALEAERDAERERCAAIAETPRLPLSRAGA